uniref:Protoheme IX farnesyltransferase, mitochondrial n=1 Tax=Caenorhabditis japonica TaxID=281687 RepID=A0A8R1E4I8_CAEJA
MRQACAYVQQVDLFCGTLTVREQLTYTAWMRMKDSTDEEKAQRVENVLRDMNLIDCQNTLIVTDQYLQQWYKMETKSLAADYLALSKSKLSMFVAATAACGFLMAPVPVAAAPLAAATVGTFLLSSAANSCNQLLEAPYDAQMRRTQGRVLVVHRFSPLHAFTFAGVTGLTGIGLLGYFGNPTAAVLGAINWFLYAGVYTPMKRSHIGCTWAGAVVGAIPPLMGYAAATGYLDPASWCLAAILFSWQFPHFNGLSWNLRGDYSKAGYRVMCVTNERLCRVTSIRHSLALLGLCTIVAPLTNLTTMTFALGRIKRGANFVLSGGFTNIALKSHKKIL